MSGAVPVTFRVGLGFDVHRLGPGVPLILGGMRIPFELGLIGHSDGDVLSHAITDALLGACGAGNIGELFPDTDPQYRGASSLTFLRKAAEIVRDRGMRVGNIDSNILAERPKLSPFFPAICDSLAAAIGVGVDRVHVKAKTMERLGPIGQGEAMAAEAVVLLTVGGDG